MEVMFVRRKRSQEDDTAKSRLAPEVYFVTHRRERFPRQSPKINEKQRCKTGTFARKQLRS
jgi:hypothetical protein